MADRYDEELFLGYIEGDLTPEQTREFEKLLVEDARLRNLVAQLVIDRHRLRNLPEETAPLELMEQVNQQLERAMLLGERPVEAGLSVPARGFRLKRWVAYASVAAMLAVGATVVITILNNQALHQLASSQQPGKPLASGRDPTTGIPETVAPGGAAIPGPLADASSARDESADLDKALAMGTDQRMAGDGGRKDDAPARAVAEPAVTPPALSAAKSGEASGGAAQLRAVGTNSDRLKQAERANDLSKDGNNLPDAVSGSGPAIAASPAPALPAEAPAQARTRGTAYKENDVPVPHPVNRGPVTEPHSMRLEVTTNSPAVSERELLAWAQKNHVRVVPPEPKKAAQDATLVGGTRGDEKADHAGGAGGGGATIAEEKEAGADAAGPRQVVLILEGRQVAELVSHLNLQRGQTAALTHEVVQRGFAAAAPAPAAEKLTTGASANESMEAASSPTTQPATRPASGVQPGATKALRETAKAESRLEVEAGEELQRQRITLPPDAAVPADDPRARIRLPVIIEQRQADR